MTVLRRDTRRLFLPTNTFFFGANVAQRHIHTSKEYIHLQGPALPGHEMADARGLNASTSPAATMDKVYTGHGAEAFWTRVRLERWGHHRRGDWRPAYLGWPWSIFFLSLSLVLSRSIAPNSS